jgi:hypothetical protein
MYIPSPPFLVHAIPLIMFWYGSVGCGVPASPLRLQHGPAPNATFLGIGSALLTALCTKALHMKYNILTTFSSITVCLASGYITQMQVPLSYMAFPTIFPCSYVMKKPKQRPARGPRWGASPEQLLDYRCHVTSVVIGTTYPPQVTPWGVRVQGLGFRV